MEKNNTPGAAIGSFIVIAILVVGAIYMLVGQMTKTPANIDNSDDTALEATSTLPEDADLDLINATSSSPLSDKEDRKSVV